MTLLTTSSLHRNYWAFGEYVEDLSTVDKSVEKISISSKAKNFSLLTEFKQLKMLNISGEQIREERFEIICKAATLQALRIKWLQVKDLSSLAKLKNLEYLMINGNSKTEDISAIGKLRNLKELSLTDFQNVNDISPLSNLTNLKELALEGGIWNAMKVKSIKPLENLSSLNILYITNLRIQDDSFRCLGNLSNLNQLAFGNFFSAEDVAYLKKKLPNTQSGWFDPIREVKFLHCKKCKSKLVLITGQGGRKFCPKCNSAKIAELTRIFN